MPTPRPVFLLALLAACRSADSWRADADEEAYAILEQRRAELGAAGDFTIDPPADPLRERLKAAESAGSSEPLVLDLVGCLQVAAENSREWQDQRESLFRAALDLTLARWDYTVQEKGTLGAAIAGTGFTGEKHVPGEVESEGGFTSNLNLFKLLGIGTQVVGDIGLDFVRDLGTGDGWDAVSHLSLNITQPILRGFGAEIVKEPLTQAEREVLYEARAYERFRRTFAVDIAQRFFQVLEQLDRLKNEDANHLNLTRLRERNEALAEAGRLTDIQVDQARQDEFSAEDRLVAARRDLEAALDDFKFALGLPIGTELVLAENGLRSLEAWPALAADLPEDQAVHLGLEKRLDYATALDQIDDAARRVRVAADGLRMGFDIKANAEVFSPEGRPAGLRADDVKWDIGFDLDLPIDRIPERNSYRDALITLEERRRAAEASADRVTSELRDALRRLDAARASFRIQSGSVVLAERRVESAVLNLEAGRASTRDVLEAQDSKLSAQNALAGALTDTILAGLFLYRDMELLEVTPNGIEVLQVESQPAQP
jgi:outer membrane protein TolC